MSQVIHETAQIGPRAAVGHFVVIGENVRIGADCSIGHHVVIHPDTQIGERVVVADHAVLGKAPERSAAMAEIGPPSLPPARLGSGVCVGVGAVVYRGAAVSDDAFIADYAALREESSVGSGTVIGRGAAIENRVQIGSACKIESGVFIAALSVIEDGCFVAPEATVTNDRYLGRTHDRSKHYKGITIKKGGRVGANATLLPGLTIGADGVAGAGSVMTHDIPSQQVAVGNPARASRKVADDQLLKNQSKTLPREGK